MIAELNIGGQRIRAALERGVSLAIAVDFASPGPRHRRRWPGSCFHAVFGRQLLRQRRDRRQRQLFDDHPDAEHREAD